ncbi:MAG: tryptophanase [Cyclobacteriaceae bacterium]|nr:tryptophanase [Cyclobacteriaceae bacterium]
MKKERTLAEPFRIKMVEPLRMTSESYRDGVLREAGYNPFLLKSDDVYIDLLTDSGTGAMSDRQWAGVMVGDESYAGARSWQHLESVVKELTGMPYILPTHQGRAAERILYGLIGGKNKVFLSNTHFDTTRANIEFTGAQAIDLPAAEAADTQSDFPFKGNMDLLKMEREIINRGSENIAAVIMTITNNSAGGQPVSMENMRAVRALCSAHKLMLVVDGCRMAENSYFIRHREPAYANKSYEAIAREVNAMADVFIMSAKKDGLVNIGGVLAMKSEQLYRQCTNLLIISEGFTTYGGLAGRDMEAMAIGLREVFDPDYLHYRIRSTMYLGEQLRAKGVPVLWPVGGHAVYVDAKKLYSNIPVEQFPGQVLVCDLYLKGGIRCVEVGSVMFGKYDKNNCLIPAQHELVRLAVPRRVYTQSHIDYVVDVFDDILELTDKTNGYRIVEEPPFLRHFTARFEKI